MRRGLTLGFLVGGCTIAWAQQALTLRDISDKNPRTLTKDEVTKLMPGAKVSRVTVRGNRHDWTNEPGGSFVVSSDNRGSGVPQMASGRPSMAPGKWHISDDGRYCILIEWKGIPTEEWCRYVLETSDGYYMARSTMVGTEHVDKFEIRK
jgi:hypothetical protein